MEKLLITAAFISFCGAVSAQESNTVKAYANEITTTDLKDYLTIIASDALEGRRTGTRGQKMAAAFIANHFQEIGLTPPVNGSYYQPVELYSSTISEAYIKTGAGRYENFADVIYFGTADSGGEISTDVVFAGKGEEADYKQIDVKDKAVVFLVGKLKMGMLRELNKLAQTARDKGARLTYILTESTPEEYRKYADLVKGFASSGAMSLEKPSTNPASKGLFIINQIVAEKLFSTTFVKLKKAADDPKMKSLKSIKQGKSSYGVTSKTTTVKTENVLGYLEGSDKKDEVVLVTAHYDHIGLSPNGTDHINNGADDDGSGTVSVMEIAKTFARAKKEGHGPRRSMLFMTVVAEELGLFGSEYYVEHPVYPLAKTVVDLNIDMIGRNDPEHKDKPEYVYVIGSDKLSTELHVLNEKANTDNTKLALDYTYNDENHPTNLYKRSDHWNFAKNGIPIIFYFDGIHEDYHQPSDEVGKINFEILAKRAQLVFFTAWEVANREQRIVNDKK